MLLALTSSLALAAAPAAWQVVTSQGFLDGEGIQYMEGACTLAVFWCPPSSPLGGRKPGPVNVRASRKVLAAPDSDLAALNLSSELSVPSVEGYIAMWVAMDGKAILVLCEI